MRPICAVVVGIGTYADDTGEFPSLAYATADAERILGYLETCWPEASDYLVSVRDGDATLDALAGAFTRLAREGPFDLQFVFLSGHGCVADERTGFLVRPADGSSALTFLTPARLDELLGMVHARQTVLILDCCQAEGIIGKMQFFRTLEQDEARLFVASSRHAQLTWEDDAIEHGIFTAHLLDLLNTGNSIGLSGIRDRLDVDGDIFRVLCEQVPLYVLEHKGQRQEPVKGGVSMRPVTLPVVRSRRRIKERTPLATALRRVRQIGAGAMLCSIGFLVMAYLLAYYAEADRAGNIHLHHGTKWMAGALRILPTLRTDTAISWRELSEDPTSRYALQAGATWGFWTQRSRSGPRSWYERIRPGLSPQAMARYDVLLSTGAEHPVDRLNDESRPSEVVFAAWALLDEPVPAKLDLLFNYMIGADRVDPVLTPFVRNQLDFNVLDRSQSQLAAFADALRTAAIIDPDRTFVAYAGFLKANQEWLTHSSLEQHGQEAQRRAVEDVADVLAVIARARVDRGETGLSQQQLGLLDGLANLGYGDLVRVALSRIATTAADRRAEAAHALAAFHGRPAEVAQGHALRRLKDSLDASAESRAVVQRVYQRFVEAGAPEHSDLTAFLIRAADRQALPASVISMLLAKAKEAVARPSREFMDREYARILSHGMSQIPAEARGIVYRLIALTAADVTPKATSTAEMYAALARQGLETPAMFEHVVAQVQIAPPYRPDRPELVSEPLPGLSIVVGSGPWIEALAVIAYHRAVPGHVIALLEARAVDPTFRPLIVKALARQATPPGRPCWESNCIQMLSAFPTDGARRLLAADILAERLAALPRPAFMEGLQKLKTDRSAETEPEVRIALGLAIINAQLLRVSTPESSRQLFEAQ